MNMRNMTHISIENSEGNCMNLTLAHPTLEMEQAYLDYIDEWRNAGEKVSPWSTDPQGKDYATWLEATRIIQKRETCPSNLVPADTYFLTDETGRILGAINIRHTLNDYLFEFGGHIGYGVRPSDRKKGYAKKMLRMALGRCRELGLSKVLVICDRENPASAKTIVRNGGILESEVPDGKGMMQRYWIEL